MLQTLLDAPARYLAHKASAGDRDSAELATLALVRLASTDTEAAADALKTRWEHDLPDDLAAWAWAATAKQSAMRLSDDAPEQFQRAALRAGRQVEERALDPGARGVGRRRRPVVLHDVGQVSRRDSLCALQVALVGGRWPHARTTDRVGLLRLSALRGIGREDQPTDPVSQHREQLVGARPRARSRPARPRPWLRPRGPPAETQQTGSCLLLNC